MYVLVFFLIPRQDIKKQRHLLTNVHIVKVMVFPVVMYGCESWTRKKAECKRIDAFELWCWRRLLSPLGGKVIKSVIPKGYQPWLFIGRTDAEVKAPIVWLPDGKSQYTGKDPDAGKDWGQEERGSTEDEIVGWHHWLNGYEFEQIQGDSEGQGSLACCSSWGRKESDMAWWLNNKKWFKLILISYFTDEDTEVQKNEIDYQRLVSHPCLYGSRIEKIELRVVSWQHLKCQDNLFPL